MAAANSLIPSQIGDLDDLKSDFELLLREGGDGSFRSYGENHNVTFPAFSMEDWIVDCSPQEGKSVKESRELFPLFEFQSNFQTLKGWSDDGCNTSFGFGRNDAGIKNRSFTDILQLRMIADMIDLDDDRMTGLSGLSCNLTDTGGSFAALFGGPSFSTFSLAE